MNSTHAHMMDLYEMVVAAEEAQAFRTAQRRLRDLPRVPSPPAIVARPWHVAVRAHSHR